MKANEKEYAGIDKARAIIDAAVNWECLDDAQREQLKSARMALWEASMIRESSEPKKVYQCPDQIRVSV